MDYTDIAARLTFEDNATSEINKLENKVKDLESALGDTQKKASGLGDVFKGVIAADLFQRGIQLTIDLGLAAIDASKRYETLRASFKNAFGSLELGDAQLKKLEDFAKTTTFQFEEIANSYLKLKNRGFEPTIAELTKIGDLAASQGKSFDQLAEAILDAQTGEFERLKEFGVTIKTVGDNAVISFRGVEQQVKKTDQDAIRNAIINLGAMEGVVGSLAEQSKTLAGAQSNLSDTMSILGRLIGDRVTPYLKEGILSLTEFADGIIDMLDPTAALEEEFSKTLQTVVTTQNELPKLTERYDKLKGQKNLNKKEQAELNSVIQKIIEIAPLAASEMDKYGKVISVNTDIAKAYTKEQRQNLIELTRLRLANAEAQQQTLQGEVKSLESIRETVKGQVETAKAFGVIKKESELFTRESEKQVKARQDLENANKVAVESRRLLEQLEKGETITLKENTEATKANTKAKQGQSEEEKKREEQLKKDLENLRSDLNKQLERSNIDAADNAEERLKIEREAELKKVALLETRLQEVYKALKKEYDLEDEFRQLRLNINEEFDRKELIQRRKATGAVQEISTLRNERLNPIVSQITEQTKTAAQLVNEALDRAQTEAALRFEKFILSLENPLDRIKFRFAKALGLDTDDIDKFQENTDKLFGQLNTFYNKSLDAVLSFNDAQIAQNEKKIAQLDNDLQKQKEIVDREFELKKEGFASNYESEKEALDNLQKQREEAAKKQQELELKRLRIQQAADAASQVSSLITAGAEIFKDGVKKAGIIGLLFAAAGVASLIALFAGFKAQAARATAETTKLRKGGRIQNGRSHEQNGHRIEGTDIEVEDKEWVVNARDSEEQDRFLKRLNKGEFRGIDLTKMVEAYKNGLFDTSRIDKAQMTIYQLNDKRITDAIDRQTRQLLGQKKIVSRGDGKQGYIEIIETPNGTITRNVELLLSEV